MLILKTKTNCLLCYSLNGTFWFKKQYKLLKTLFWHGMLCFSTFLKYLVTVLAQTPATYILMYCNASSTAFPAEHCFQFMKKTSDVCCLMSNVRHLMLYVMLLNCYQTSDVRHQTSDNSYMTEHVWCQTSDIRHLITVTWQQTSDVCYVI